MSTITTARSALGAGIDPRGPRFAASLTIDRPRRRPGHADARRGRRPGLPDTGLRDRGGPRRSSTRPTPGSSGLSSARGSAAPSELEDPRPPRFAQAVGLGFAVVGLVGFLTGLTALGLVATGFALAAALLNAVFGFCLGCEIYLLLQRATAR